MTDEFLNCLRCPIDPQRESTLRRDGTTLYCESCAIAFPVKNGIPILIPDAATLPDHMREISQLPCQRRENRRINRESL